MKPYSGLIVTVLVVLPPAATDPLVGLVEIVKSGETTLSVTVVVLTVLPLVPVMVKVDDPVGVVVGVDTVSVDVPEVVIEVGEKPYVAFVGKPLADKPTAPVNPPDGERVTVYCVLLPRPEVPEVGLAVSVKFGLLVPIGTICMPFSGARSVEELAVLGIAVIVKPVAVDPIVKTT